MTESETTQPTEHAAQGVQVEMPLAMVNGHPVGELPSDLYIPPDALEVILDAFEGPLDLLLYLIRRQNLDILNIPVATITEQYIAYIEVMQEMRFELAAEYLVMAAILAEIKSRLLIPKPKTEEEEEEDPRNALIRQLLEYERYKEAAENMDALPREERDFSTVHHVHHDAEQTRPEPEVDLRELLLALHEVLKRADLNSVHSIQSESLSVHQRMSDVLASLQTKAFVSFQSLFRLDEGRQGVVVTFLSLLELAKEQLIELVQEQPMAMIYVRAKS